MEEHFILRVPPSVAERLNRLLSENPGSAGEDVLDLAFQDARSGSFTIGEDHFPASLLDLPCVLESYKTYDDYALIKTADVGQVILVQEEGEPAPEGPEYEHGLTPVMRDARRRRFRREPDLNTDGMESERKPIEECNYMESCVRRQPDLVQQVENDLQCIMAGGTARDVDVVVVEQEEDADDDQDTEELAPRTTAAAKKPNAAAAAVATATADEEMGDGDDDDDFEDEDDDED